MATPGPAGNPGLYGVQGMAHSAAVRFRYTSHSSNYSITTQSPADCFVFYWNTNGEYGTGICESVLQINKVAQVPRGVRRFPRQH